MFYVIQGAVKFCVHKTNFILSTGGMFMVPRGEYILVNSPFARRVILSLHITGNVYYIQNICDRDAKLFFAQARKMPVELLQEFEDGAESESERPRSRSKSANRGQSQRASSDTVNGDGPAPEAHPRRRGSSKR